MVGCEIVWTSLPGPAQVESALLGNEAGALSAMAAGAALVDTTTNDPDVARRVSTRPAPSAVCPCWTRR